MGEGAAGNGGLTERQSELLANALRDQAARQPEGASSFLMGLLIQPDAERLPTLHECLRRARQELVALRATLEAKKLEAENRIDADVAAIDALLARGGT